MSIDLSVYEMKTLLTQPKLNKLGIDIQYNDATRRVTINTRQSERHGEKLKSIKLKNHFQNSLTS